MALSESGTARAVRCLTVFRILTGRLAPAQASTKAGASGWAVSRMPADNAKHMALP
jgi:hypothetical protein